jgi:hypothetical protein
MKTLMRLLALVISIAADFVRQFFPDVTIFLPEWCARLRAFTLV